MNPYTREEAEVATEQMRRFRSAFLAKLQEILDFDKSEPFLSPEDRREMEHELVIWSRFSPDDIKEIIGQGILDRAAKRWSDNA